MAIIKKIEMKKMNENERTQKIKELKIELIKSRVGDKSGKIKTKEIKKAIARLLTFNRINNKSIDKK